MSSYDANNSTERPHANATIFQIIQIYNCTRNAVDAPLSLRILLECGFPHNCPSYTSSSLHCIRPDHARTVYSVHQVVNVFQNIDSAAQRLNTNRLYLFEIIHGETVGYVIRPSAHVSCALVYVLHFHASVSRWMIHFLIPNYNFAQLQLPSSTQITVQFHVQCKQNPFKNTI